MQTEFTEDQQQFREVIARFLREKSQPRLTRELMQTNSGYDPAVWRQLSGELGLTGTHIPEAFGGYGFGPVELGIAAEEMGRHLYCGPFFASAVMASAALLHLARTDARDRLLPDLASGRTIATLVLDNLDAPERVGHALHAEDDRVTGTAPLVIDAQVADCLITIARTTGGLGLYQVSPQADGVHIEPVVGLDPTRKLASVRFDAAVAQSIGDVDASGMNRLWDELCVALAHEMIGGAQHLLDSTIEYTGMRYQFGRPIGSFQALKHRCADLLMEVEWAKAATHHAAACLASGEGEPYLPSMVKAMASDTYMNAAKEAIQMRGGIGFTWEEDTQLWYKRAKSSEVFLGTPAYHRERMMAVIEAQEAAP